MHFAKAKIPWPLSEAIASNHSIVFTFTLLLSQGREGDAFPPSTISAFYFSRVSPFYQVLFRLQSVEQVLEGVHVCDCV